MPNDFHGVWVLDAAASDYAQHPVPERGVYTIRAVKGGTHFHVRWVERDGRIVETAFSSLADGAPTPVPGDDTLRLASSLEEGALVTRVTREGTPLHTAVRTLEDDGQSLRVVQTMAGPAGDVVTCGVYRRSAVKQVICYRRDLKMRKGKIAAQVAHAAMAVFFRGDHGDDHQLVVPLPGPVAVWAKGRFAKVVLSVETEEDLLTVAGEANRRGIPNAVITDAGKTEFKGVPTRTTVAIGPWASAEIDEVTGRDGVVGTKLA